MTGIRPRVAPEHRPLFVDLSLLGKTVDKLAHSRGQWVAHQCKSGAGLAFACVGGSAGATLLYALAGTPGPMIAGAAGGVLVGMLLAVKWSWDDWMGAKRDYPTMLLHEAFSVDPLAGDREEWAQEMEGLAGIVVWWADHSLRLVRAATVVVDGGEPDLLGAADLPVWAPVEPGAHTVSVRLSPLAPVEMQVDVAPGERVEIGVRYALSDAGVGRLELEVLPPVVARAEESTDPASPHDAGRA